MSSSPDEIFAVLNFALIHEDDGRPTQRAESCGIYVGVERAFEVAREQAEKEYARLCSQPREPNSVIELLDTEWGYDLREDYLVVSRYWVHDRAPSTLAT